MKAEHDLFAIRLHVGISDIIDGERRLCADVAGYLAWQKTSESADRDHVEISNAGIDGRVDPPTQAEWWRRILERFRAYGRVNPADDANAKQNDCGRRPR